MHGRTLVLGSGLSSMQDMNDKDKQFLDVSCATVFINLGSVQACFEHQLFNIISFAVKIIVLFIGATHKKGYSFCWSCLTFVQA